MKKKVPEFKSDKEAEDFLEQDLTDYIDLKKFSKVNFEFLPKDKKVNLRFPEPLLEVIKQRAEREGISYQKYIRRAIEESLTIRGEL
jgi:predicted DNA binding CopG/RHH family protein